MIRVGLTGSIGTGKSTTANMAREMGVPVFDTDACVRELEQRDVIQGQLCSHFQDAVIDGQIDRAQLRWIVFADAARMKILHGIYHPVVAEERRAFFDDMDARGHGVALADVPLIFEINQQDQYDYIIATHVPEDIQKRRVLARPNMDEASFEANRQAMLGDGCVRVS